MKKFLLSILCCLMAVVSGYADEYSYTFTAAQFNSNGTKTLNGVAWNLSGEGGGYWGYDKTKGQQLGSGNKPYKNLTLSTTGIEGTITKIQINTSGASSVNASFTVSVGNTQYGSSKLTKTATDYTFTGTSSGEIKFQFTQTSSKALYIKSIVITYTTSSGDSTLETLEAPVFTPSESDFSDFVEVSIKATEGATIYYTTDNTEPTEESSVYAGPFTIYATTTVRAFAKMDGYNNSPEAFQKYTKVLTLTNCSVAEAIAAYKSGDKIAPNASIVGYIVGAADGSLNKKENFSETTTVATNLLIADDPNETNVENCMPVELPSGDIRNALNLADNPGNYKKQIVLTGRVEAYFSVAGLKKTSAYEFVEDVWGSLFSPYDVEIPENVKVYIVTGENNGYVRLANITGAVPAMTGVIYNGVWNNKEAATSALADVTGNQLKGSVNDEYVTEDAFVLAKVDGVVGFYKALMNQNEGTAFKNNGGKAYLPVSALTSSAQNAASLKFRFETTGIEGAQVAQGKKVIFDLSGRKVNDMKAPGLYIVNGKKVLVK